MDENDKIFWPPDESIAASFLGFEEVKESAQKVNDLLTSELNFKEESRLMNQILETHKNLSYADLERGLRNLILGLKTVRTN